MDAKIKQSSERYEFLKDCDLDTFCRIVSSANIMFAKNNEERAQALDDVIDPFKGKQ